jgi:serine phosphatase RsbU (regulator of sigma subunit)
VPSLPLVPLLSAEIANLTRIQRDLEVAHRLQRRLLPELPESVSTTGGDVRVVSRYLPAYELGGDYCDAVASAAAPGAQPDAVIAIIADVSGKGVSAALLVARLASEFRRLAPSAASPRVLLAELNQLVGGLQLDEMFVTATCVRIDVAAQTLTVANAGHIPAVVRGAIGASSLLGAPSGAPLGMLPFETYGDEVFPLGAGDVVVLVTDGITEALDPGASDAGADALLALVAAAAHDPDAVGDRLLASATAVPARGTFPARASLRLADDITLLALQVPAGD